MVFGGIGHWGQPSEKDLGSVFRHLDLGSGFGVSVQISQDLGSVFKFQMCQYQLWFMKFKIDIA
ncbi:MAG: hypothetical protein K2W97_09015, partial [Chthoniobacterales bacterium]|nr:hypothetical protein [Chthoniobacterales bacterium]